MARKKRKPRIKKISNLPGEEWALVNNTEDFYVSNLGRFKRVTPKGDSLRTISKDMEGYERVNIGHNKYRLHRLVAEAFVPNPNNYPIIDHLDGCKSNNVWTNLEWVDYQTNTQRAHDMGLISRTGLKSMSLAIDPDDNGILFSSQTDLARQLDLNPKIVGNVIAGKQVTTKGYRIFRLKTLEDRRS